MMIEEMDGNVKAAKHLHDFQVVKNIVRYNARQFFSTPVWFLFLC